MPDELGNFQTAGPTWQERAEKAPGIAAVYAPDNLEMSQWLAYLHDYGFRQAIKHLQQNATILDFGCGIGRYLDRFAEHAKRVIGVEITYGMLERAKENRSNSQTTLCQIDGIKLPLATASVDLIWVSAVLRYSLLVPEPKQAEIVSEFHRVLKPGGSVVNMEIYIDRPSRVFYTDFVQRGFHLRSVKVLHVYQSIFDRLALRRFKRIFLNPLWADLCVEYNLLASREQRLDNHLRDYLFIYKKPL